MRQKHISFFLILICISALFSMIPSVFASYGAEEIIAEQTTYGAWHKLDDYYNVSANTGSNYTQSFVLNEKTNITKVSLFLFTGGSPTVDLAVQILQSGFSLFTSDAVDSATIGGSAEWVNFTIQHVFEAGSYSILVSEAGAGGTIDPDNYVGVCSSDSDVVAGSFHVEWNGILYSLSPHDMEYVIYGSVYSEDETPADYTDPGDVAELIIASFILIPLGIIFLAALIRRRR